MIRKLALAGVATILFAGAAMAECCPFTNSGAWVALGTPIEGPGRFQECQQRIAKFKSKVNASQIAAWNAKSVQQVCPQVQGLMTVSKPTL